MHKQFLADLSILHCKRTCK